MGSMTELSTTKTNMIETNNFTQKELTDRLDLASRQYYNGETSEFSDTEFDLLLAKLFKMEKESGIIYPNSPTQRVGSDIQDGFKKGKHPDPMLTISNVYDDAGLQDWINKMRELGVTTINCGVKYDGVSLELHYKEGVLVQALTRGDKVVGDDVTENVKTIKSIPLVIPAKTVPTELYVRGEVLLPKSKLDALNRLKTLNGEKPFANTRNACSGSLKQLDPKVTASRGLIFKPWDWYCLDAAGRPTKTKLIRIDGGPHLNHEIGLKREYDSMYFKLVMLRDWGFSYNDSGVEIGIFNGGNIDDITISTADKTYTIPEMWATIKNSGLDYEFDGMVFKVDDLHIQERLGTKDSRSIEWGIARKWNEEYEVVTTIQDVEWSVGRTGVVTPVAILDPVSCGGVVVTRATLNNVSFIKNLGLCYYDQIRLVRSGGVIPYILGVKQHFPGNQPIEIPTSCPECGQSLMEDGEMLVCFNPDCPAQVIGGLLHWCSKDCLDVRGIGESMMVDISEKFNIKKPYELYKLMDISPEDIANTLGEGYGVKTAENIIKSLRNSIKKPLANVIYGLGIDGVGKVTARDLVKKFKTWDALAEADEVELISMDGVGNSLVESLRWCFKGESGKYVSEQQVREIKEFRDALLALGFDINPQEEVVEALESTALDGLTVVFSGKSYRFSGDEIESFLEKNGAKTSHSVSKKTNYLIVGENPGGSKVSKAKDLGVEIIEEKAFYEKYSLA